MRDLREVISGVQQLTAQLPDYILMFTTVNRMRTEGSSVSVSDTTQRGLVNPRECWKMIDPQEISASTLSTPAS